jgi:malate synthase
VRGIIAQEAERQGDGGRFPEARELFERVALAPDFPDFLTIPGYELID